MKLFRHSTIYKLLPLICGLHLSCKRLLDIPANPPAKIPTAQVFADSADALSAVVGIYNDFQITSSSSAIGSLGVPLSTGLTGDELSPTISYDQGILQLYQNAIVPQTNNNALNLWVSAYKPIYQANACLDEIPGSTGLSAALKQQFIGEIKVARAFLYFNLVNLFGSVPLVTTTDYKISAILSRSPVDSIYAQIIADLNDARQLLKPSYPSGGRARPNLYTAEALLAKVYLYRGQWQAASDIAGDLIRSGIYHLEQDLDRVYLDGSQEAIWQLPANGISNQTYDGVTFVPYDNSTEPSYLITDGLAAAFEAGDQRWVKWVGTSVAGANSYHYPYKYKNRYLPVSTTEDYMVFRLGEQYLIRAEAFARQNKPDSAVADLNQVRSRAGLGGTTAVTQMDILDAVMHERQVELFCEWGNRWYDLKRMGTIDAVLGAEKPGWMSMDALFPVPYQEIQTNPYLQQNPGYN